MLVGTALVSMLIIVALVLAASRAGLITELVVLIGIGALARELPVLRRLSFGLAAGLLVVTVVAQAVSPLLALRLRFWQTKAWYAEAIEPAPDTEPLPAKMAPGADAQVELFIRNTGKMTWPAGGKKPVKLSYHWLSDDGPLVDPRGSREPTCPMTSPRTERSPSPPACTCPNVPGDMSSGGIWFTSR